MVEKKNPEQTPNQIAGELFKKLFEEQLQIGIPGKLFEVTFRYISAKKNTKTFEKFVQKIL